MTTRPRAWAGVSLACAGTAFALLDIGGGLLVGGGYTLRTVFLHLLVVGAGAAGVVAALLPGVRDQRQTLLVASCALLIGAQAPWTTEGLLSRPWFALVGIASVAFLLASIVVVSGVWRAAPARTSVASGVERVRAHRPRQLGFQQLRRSRPTSADAPELRPGAGPTAPGWYPDPDAEAAPCWRWWDGRRWTEHRSSGAAG